MKALFVDRDGTLIEEPADFQVDALDKVRLVPGVIPALLELGRAGYELVMVSNQDGLGSDAFPQAQFDACQQHVLSIFESQGIRFSEIFICPHTEADQCECRKPRAGLLTRYLASNDIDTARSAVIGDRETDLQLAERIGVRGIRVNSGDGSLDWPAVAELLCHSERVATRQRNTNETRIRCAVNLDADRDVRVSTGIGFFDHMLEQVARHAAISLQIDCEGDLHVDEHHTVEDVAIVLGQAIRDALDNKRGIARYGFVLPMDESEAHASLDLSGRYAFEFAAQFPRDNVGGLSTEMVEHFFRSFAESLGAALHLRIRGRNTHHMVEAGFKSLGRCLRQAVRRDGNQLPSTKGMLA
ncbi:MAG: bifunctional histidinol-phosphatase/imidazoleglycerol-phosphate dehydratase HisB [Woeseiaceae bacterium]|nr:bifunctional histidinol-phosphatase/imidazoleglycerol-phosphate dehydratase HisB [Woeseiaceae bacterium]